MHYNWLVELGKSLFVKADNRIAVINKRDNDIIAILTSDPNGRMKELKSNDLDISLSGSIQDASASIGVKDSFEITWSDKKLTKEIHAIGKNSQWVFNTDDENKHYLTILNGKQVDSYFQVIGATAYIPIGHEVVIGNDIPIIDGLKVPATVVVRGLPSFEPITDDKYSDEVTPFTEKDKKEREESDKPDKVEEKKEITKEVVSKATPVKFNPRMIGTSIIPNPKYKTLFGLKTANKIDVLNNRDHPILAILSSVPDKASELVHHEGVIVPSGGGTTFMAFSTVNELTVVIASEDGILVVQDHNHLAIRWKKSIKIGQQWIANMEMIPRKIPSDILDQYI